MLQRNNNAINNPYVGFSKRVDKLYELKISKRSWIIMKIGDQVIYKTPEWNYLSVIIAISADGSNYMISITALGKVIVVKADEISSL